MIWILAKFRYFECGGSRKVEIHENAQNEHSLCLAIMTEQAWSIQNLLRGHCVCSYGNQGEIPSRQDRLG